LTAAGIVIAAMAKPEPPERSPARVGYLIARADRGVRRGVATLIAPHDLSLPQYTALSLLRVLRTELTADGRRVLATCDALVDDYEQELLAELSPRQQSTLREALAKITRAAEANG
jgi:hypothetical protein